MSREEKLKKPACSKWNELANKKPEQFTFVLVNTQYCRYPAQTALWNGFQFRATDNGKFLNVTHWAEINDLGQNILPYHENDKMKALNISIDQISSSFEVIRPFEYEEENISLIYENIGFLLSELIRYEDILKTKSELKVNLTYDEPEVYKVETDKK